MLSISARLASQSADSRSTVTLASSSLLISCDFSSASAAEYSCIITVTKKLRYDSSGLADHPPAPIMFSYQLSARCINATDSYHSSPNCQVVLI